MSTAGNASSSRKPDLDDPIDVFLSEADEPKAPAGLNRSSEGTAPLQAMAASIRRLTALIPHGSRELWTRALLVSAGLAMIATAAVLVLRPEPDEAVQPIVPAPFLSVIPSAPVTSPEKPAVQPIAPLVIAAAKAETEASRAERTPGVAVVASTKAEHNVLPADSSRTDRLLLDEEAPPLSPEPSSSPARELSPAAELTPAPAVITPRTPPDLGVADRLSSDKTAITSVLGAYQRSYSALDADTVSTIWQGLDVRALRRAFSTLSSQALSFDRCDVQVDSDVAKATCAGRLSYVRKIGDDGPHERRLSWTIDLRRNGDRWLIANVLAR